jgi:hypothetical protein
MSDTDQIETTEDRTTPTEGEARLALETGPCVVAVGEREVCECYQNGEEQTHEDQANAVHIVKLWNSEPIIRQAILIIGVEAEALRSGCMAGNKEWACKDCTGQCESRQEYDRMMACYADLKTLVRS